eukprot:3534540-Prymnesium_polylepis.1
MEVTPLDVILELGTVNIKASADPQDNDRVRIFHVDVCHHALAQRAAKGSPNILDPLEAEHSPKVLAAREAVHACRALLPDDGL